LQPSSFNAYVFHLQRQDRHPEQLEAGFLEGIVDAGRPSGHTYVQLTAQPAGELRGSTAVPLELIVLHRRLA
jgi:hypothetical protein